MGKQWKKAGKLAQADKKGSLFTRLSREIQVAVRKGGGSNIENNSYLKMALGKARTHSLPKDTIDRAIQRGMGHKENEQIEELLYEGFGPHGVAVLVLCLTNNRARTVSVVRHLFKKNHGNLGENGSVLWMFNKVAFVQAYREIDKNPAQVNSVENTQETEILTVEEVAIEAGAEDIELIDSEKEMYLFSGKVDKFNEMQIVLEKNSWVVESVELAYKAKLPYELKAEEKKEAENFLSLLADNDECQNVYSNLS